MFSGFLWSLVLLCTTSRTASTSATQDDRHTGLTFDSYPGQVLSIPMNATNVTQTTTKVLDKMDCVFSCTKEQWCRSSNYMTTAGSDGLHVCVLISTDKNTNHNYLKQDGAFIHFSIKNPCVNNPCLNSGVCTIHYNRKHYNCHRKEGFSGNECQECTGKALGMESRAILDSAVTSSSSHGGGDAGFRARLNNVYHHWAPSASRLGEWLQVDFNKSTLVTKVATQGRPFLPVSYMTSYSLSYRRENESWQNYVHVSLGEILPGNTNYNDAVTNTLDPKITTRYIRINPKTWHFAITIRVEFYGC